MRRKANRSMSLVVVFSVIITGYVFFFASPYIFPGGRLMAATAYNQAIAMTDNNRLKLLNIFYGELDHRMEIELDLETITSGYQFKIAFRQAGGSVTVSNKVKVIEDGDMVILLVDEVPKRHREVSITLMDPAGRELAKIYGNKDSIATVDYVEEKSLAVYRIRKTKYQIGEYEKEIETIKQEMQSLTEQIQSIELVNQRLEKEKPYQTENEIIVTENTIGSNQLKIANLEKEKKQKENEVVEYQEKIRKANLKINEMEKSFSK